MIKEKLKMAAKVVGGGVGGGVMVGGLEREILLSSWFTYLKVSGLPAAPLVGRMLAFLVHTPLSCYRSFFIAITSLQD